MKRAFSLEMKLSVLYVAATTSEVEIPFDSHSFTNSCVLARVVRMPTSVVSLCLGSPALAGFQSPIRYHASPGCVQRSGERWGRRRVRDERGSEGRFFWIAQGWRTNKMPGSHLVLGVVEVGAIDAVLGAFGGPFLHVLPDPSLREREEHHARRDDGHPGANPLRERD